MFEAAASKIDVFKGLSRAQLAELMSWMERHEFDKNTVIFQEGDPCHGLFVLVSGKVAVLKQTERGILRLATLSGPSFFGEAALMVDEPRSSAIKADTDLVVGFLPAATFDAKLNAHSLTALLISVNIAKLLSERLIETDKKIASFAAKVNRMKRA